MSRDDGKGIHAKAPRARSSEYRVHGRTNSDTTMRDNYGGIRFGAKVRLVLTQPSYRHAAQRIADSMRKLDGIREAADRIERLVGGHAGCRSRNPFLKPVIHSEDSDIAEIDSLARAARTSAP